MGARTSADASRLRPTPKCPVAGQLRRQVPDFLLVTDAGPVVVDVKPRQHLGKGKTAFILALAWCRVAIEDRGWELGALVRAAGPPTRWIAPPQDGATLSRAYQKRVRPTIAVSYLAASSRFPGH